jgi:glycosyltransferase involved in cell wall biosynthesis
MDPYRRIREVIIPCIETLSRDIPNVHFVIAGRGELRNDFVRARQGEYGMYFTLLDFIPNHELPAYYAACDMTISPLDTQYVHTRNTISTKVIESIAVGKPIVATRTRAISYDYRDLKGVLWTGDDLRSFHHSIVEMYENCEFYTQQARIQSDEMGRFLKEFTSSEIVNAMAKVCSF